MSSYVSGYYYRVYNKKQLQKLLKTGNFLYIKQVYINEKWWQFWKIKKFLYYEVLCTHYTIV